MSVRADRSGGVDRASSDSVSNHQVVPSLRVIDFRTWLCRVYKLNLLMEDTKFTYDGNTANAWLAHKFTGSSTRERSRPFIRRS